MLESPLSSRAELLENPDNTMGLINQWIHLRHDIARSSLLLRKSEIPERQYETIKEGIEEKSLKAQQIFDKIKHREDLTKVLADKSVDFTSRFHKAQGVIHGMVPLDEEIKHFNELKDKIAASRN